MITILKTSGLVLNPLPELVPDSWVNVVSPSPEEIQQLQQLGLVSDYIMYSLDLDERPRVERDEGQMLIVVRVPYYQGDNVDIPYTTVPMGVIITEDALVTISKVETDVLRDIGAGRVRGFSTSKRPRFLLHLLLATASKYLVYLREINRRVDALEDQLQRSIQNSEVLALLKYQKSLVYFTTALKSNELMMMRLQRSQIFQMHSEDLDLLEDVLTENQQAIEMVNIASSILSGMMDAFASIISNNLNVVMKFLASITIILSLPSVVAGFFGMNVRLPGGAETSPFAFAIILIISVAIALSVTYLFAHKKWL